MRIDLETMQKIERYLMGDMRTDEVLDFEKQINNDPELKKAVDQQRDLMKAVEKTYVKNAAVKAGQKIRLYSLIKKGGIVVSIIVVLVAAYMGYDYVKDRLNHSTSNEQNIVIPDIEKGKVYGPDAFIQSQYFEIDGTKDTVIVGSQGTMFAIPAGSFVDENNNKVTGKIRIELKEALDPATIMMSGLSTFSGDKPLETGGMFYINASSDGKDLKISEEGILTSVPQMESKPGMMIFDGVVGEDGNIDWVNPKELENFLLPVDMRALDFYPQGYVDKVRQLSTDAITTNQPSGGIHTDSLKPDSGGIGESQFHTTSPDLDRNPDWFPTKHYLDSLYLSFEEKTDGEAIDSVKTDNGFYFDEVYGGETFVTSCNRCHTTDDKNLIGPGLKGVRQRWSNEKDLYAFIRNSKEFLKTGDQYANGLFQKYGTDMPAYNLTDKQIENILKYIDFVSPSGNQGNPGYGISPSKVLSFWNPKFNNTILATKEFEQRMKLIHQTCNNTILDLYINNLDKKLWEIDLMAAEIAGGYAPEFRRFAEMKHGGVQNGNKQYEMLQDFYRRQSKIYSEVAIKTTRAFFDKNQQADLFAQRKTYQFQNMDSKRDSKLWNEEFDLNLNEAYRQLGKNRSNGGNQKMQTPNIYFGATVTANIRTTGWKNVDAYVTQSLASRTTLDYTDSTNGKKAVIVYKEMKIRIQDESNYDLINVYLIPDKLTTYMKVGKKGDAYSENLNELITYDLVAVGYKNKQVFYAVMENVLPSTYTLYLQKGDVNEVYKELSSVRNQKASVDLKMAIDFSVFQIQDNERKNQFNKVISDREMLRPIVLPCYSISIGGMDVPKDTLTVETKK